MGNAEMEGYLKLVTAIGKSARKDFTYSFKTIAKSLKKLYKNKDSSELTDEQRFEELSKIYLANTLYYDTDSFFRGKWAREIISDTVGDYYLKIKEELIRQYKIPDFDELRERAATEYKEYVELQRKEAEEGVLSVALGQYILNNNLSLEEAAEVFNVKPKEINKWLACEEAIPASTSTLLLSLIAESEEEGIK